jgi:hypothetical protein
MIWLMRLMVAVLVSSTLSEDYSSGTVHLLARLADPTETKSSSPFS